jgi:CHAT domain-containing protein
VSGAELTAVARDLSRLVKQPVHRRFMPLAERAYEWLIRPIEADLEQLPQGTLVWVPSGPLRGVPVAALRDARTGKFLVQRHPIATIPGLSLVDPAPLPQKSLEVLKAGLSEGVQGFPPLPFVEDEIERVDQLFVGPKLFNRGFVAGALSRELDLRAFGAVHVASHAEFGGSASSAFVLTYDEKLPVARLSEMLSRVASREHALELLTLSACETAAGDDRAVLGIAGMALKAGARSTLATLWSVNDEATSRLVSEFYRHLAVPGTSRAAALQAAQVSQIESEALRHPAYWAPFVLIGSWL